MSKRKSNGSGDRERTKPKQALTAYNLFFKEERRKILEHRKSVGFATLAQAVAKRWKSISKEEHAFFVGKAAEDKERHKKEMSEWMKNSTSIPTQQWLSEKRKVVEDIQNRIISQQLAQDAHGQQPTIQNMHPSEYHWQQIDNSAPYQLQHEFDSRMLSDGVLAVASPVTSPPSSYFQTERRITSTESEHGLADLANEGYRVENPLPADSPGAMLMMRQRNLLQEGEVSNSGPMVGETATRQELPTMLSDRDCLNFAASSMRERDFANEPLIPDDKHNLTFTPGSLSRVFGMSAADLGTIPDPCPDFPTDFRAADQMDSSTEELVRRMLHHEGDKKPPAAPGNNR